MMVSVVLTIAAPGEVPIVGYSRELRVYAEDQSDQGFLLDAGQQLLRAIDEGREQVAEQLSRLGVQLST